MARSNSDPSTRGNSRSIERWTTRSLYGITIWRDTILRRYIVGGIAALGLVAAAPVAAPAAPASSHAAIASKTCSAAFTHAVIGGSHKCLHRGEFCSAAYKRQYVRYGFRCIGGRLR